jgi:two-component system cell cycle response regulator
VLRRIREIQARPEGVGFPVGQTLCAVLLAATAVYAVEALLVTQGALDTFFDTRVYNGLLIAASLVCLTRGLLVRAERLPWLLLGTALALWTTGDLYYYFFLSGTDVVPIPSVADPFYLVFYPVSYVALALLLRKRMLGFRGHLWLDGVIASLAVAAVGAAVVFDEVLKTTGGSALVIATNLAYPLADLLLLSLVAAMFALTGWRFDATWALVGLGFGVFAIADTVYLYETAAGTYVEGGPLDVGWPAALVLIACSAWQPIRRLHGVRDASWTALTVPTVFAAVGLTVLVYDHFVRINTLAVGLATATIAAVIVRAVLTFRERVRLLATSREEALTDALTGLGNRRRFVADLERGLVGSEPTALVVFDLDGFKSYNDAFGHTAGDTLLGRVARRLAAATQGYGRSYRLGGDEFCLLVPAAYIHTGKVIEQAAEALTEEGEGFAVSCSYGAVTMPAEASDLTEALRKADDRMYLHKQRNRPSAERQSIDVLVSVLNERDSLLAHHLADVADLVEAVSRRLNVPPPELQTIRQAAELHDVGKLAIPEEILAKPGPLTDDEWVFVRRHTLIGERILASAPALRPAGEIVRSSHERWDGGGYPDQLCGDEIPLGARIIAVCDAFDAMTSVRPYARVLSADEAIRELFRCVGTQFDPEVVEAFGEVHGVLNAELVA